MTTTRIISILWTVFFIVRSDISLYVPGRTSGYGTQFIPAYYWPSSVPQWHAVSPLACSQLLYLDWPFG
jgi:hypothetical protein